MPQFCAAGCYFQRTILKCSTDLTLQCTTAIIIRCTTDIRVRCGISIAHTSTQLMRDLHCRIRAINSTSSAAISSTSSAVISSTNSTTTRI
jgi:hypothetical protein